MDLLTSLNADLGLTVVMVTHEADIAAYAAAHRSASSTAMIASDTAKDGDGLMFFETSGSPCAPCAATRCAPS
jgi:energy-coupling factor transporter ATP-binding protein EcfA2